MGIRLQDGMDANGILQYEVILDRNFFSKRDEVLDWCVNEFKPATNRWSWSSAFGNTFITFYSEKDRNWFLLRWTDNGIFGD